MEAASVILLVASLALAVFDVVRSEGKSSLGWAVTLTDLALLLPVLRAAF